MDRAGPNRCLVPLPSLFFFQRRDYEGEGGEIFDVKLAKKFVLCVY